MTGLELLKAPEATAGEIADIISAPCPPTIPAHCDGVSCRECWLTWLTGEPIKEKEPPDKRTAPDDAPAYYFKRPTVPSYDRYIKTAAQGITKASKAFMLDAVIDEDAERLTKDMEENPGIAISIGNKLTEILGLTGTANLKKL